MGVLGAGQAQAVVVNVNGQNWNVTTFTGTFNNNISKFQTQANGGVMPWWTGSNGENSTAISFANAVGLSLDLPNFANTGGPIFAFSPGIIGSGNNNPFITYVEEDPPGEFFIPCPGCNPVSRDETATWAQADLVPAPAPGPLPVFGAAAAFGFSRKLRKRLIVSKAVGTSFPGA